MAQSRTLGIRRPTAREEVHRVYAVTRDSSAEQGRCLLEDGSAVVCAFETMKVAVEATADNPNLCLVRHRALSSEERERVERALLA